jgi:glycine/serine hydroxymethyltransferase
LRLGVSEMTRFGMKEPDFRELASLFADAVRNGSGVAEKVAEFRGRFRAMKFCFDDEALKPLKERLLETF